MELVLTPIVMVAAWLLWFRWVNRRRDAKWSPEAQRKRAKEDAAPDQDAPEERHVTRWSGEKKVVFTRRLRNSYCTAEPGDFGEIMREIRAGVYQVDRLAGGIFECTPEDFAARVTQLPRIPQPTPCRR